MNESANLVSLVQNITTEEAKKKLFVERLRGNILLRWVARLRKIKRYKESLRNFDFLAELKIEAGILSLESVNSVDYLGIEFIPYVKNGYSSFDIAFLMKSEIVLFESEYGSVVLTGKEMQSLDNIGYKYNKMVHSFNVPVDNENLERLTCISDSAIILNRLLTSSILLKNISNTRCSLEYTTNQSTLQYNTIFNEEELILLEKVNKMIQMKK